ncbi:hypothetical protein Clacol_007757 [Clathrus columnatus]|uniref:histone acetyltransferase n=1 Tax=Clathrus columnatus TaxID=1419009 RepID=A0AAV5AJ15_9AGAM|nr:hypothetical protein Clacol_007757 [Clathrus columnatus]
MQEVLILLSEQTSSTTNDGDKTLTFSPPVFVTAIEVDIFFFPASSSTILYVSKVDGTGQGTYPSPTSTLVNALLQFYASPSSPIYPTNRNHTLWIHLFARAQRQYLFPNSADHPDKTPLGDVALCKWWKTSLGKVASDVQKALESLDPLRQTELEATYSLGIGNESSTESQWIYSHPYDVHKDLNIPFVSASPGSGSKENHLPSLIPYFDDDPKSRFLDELVTTSEEKTVAVPTPTPKRKRRRVDSNSNHDDSTSTSEPRSTVIAQPIAIEMPQPQRPSPPAIAFIPPSSSPPHFENDEPVERPSTPEPNLEEQTLVAPQTPQYPRLTTRLLSPHTPSPSNSREVELSPHTPQRKVPKSPHTPKTSRRPKSDLDSVSTTEFWERMSFRQECAQGAVTGFFVAVFAQKYISDEKPISNSESSPSMLVDGTVPHTVLKRVMTSLVTGVEFATTERSYKSTQTIQTAIKGLCDGLKDTSSSTSDGEKSSILEDHTGIYSRHVHASFTINNPPLLRKQLTGPSTVNGGASVNILGVRRKKKRD